jgi:hypothetical protein
VAAAGEAPRSDAAVDAETTRRLWSRWKEFLAQVRTQNGQQVNAALQAVRDVAVADQRAAFAFGNNEFSRSLVAKLDVLPGVSTTLSKFLGRELSLECQLGDRALLSGVVTTAQTPPTDGPDPLVEYAVSDLGAQVAPNPVASPPTEKRTRS